MATKPVAKTATKAASGKAVVPAKTAAVQKAGIPEGMAELYAEQAGAGLENASAQDYALPFINLLQPLSPQIDEDHDKYVEGASAGDFLNTVTGHNYGNKLKAIAVDFSKVYNEWVPRDAGGGFVKSYDDKAEAEAACQEDNQIVDTANHYLMVEDEDQEQYDQAIFSMTSTKLSASRNWLSRISQVLIPGPNGGKVVAPSFAKIYEIRSEKKKNAKGTFYVPVITPVEGTEGWVPADLFEKAMDFRAQLKAGKKGADFSKSGDAVVDVEPEDDEPGM